MAHSAGAVHNGHEEMLSPWRERRNNEGIDEERKSAPPMA